MKNQETDEANLNVSNQKTTRSKSRALPKLKLTVSTWEKQSHGLFDYQSAPQKISKEDFVIQESSRVFRNIASRKTVIRDLKEESKNLPDRIEIFKVEHNLETKTYFLKNSLSTELNPVLNNQNEQSQKIVEKQKLFVSLVVGRTGHKLQIGDFIKLGRVELVVLEIKDSKKLQSLDFQEIYGTKEFIFHQKGQLQGACKICLSDEATEEDPLVNPCNCKGTCGVIHLDCLKNWVNNKVKKDIHLKVRTYNFEKYSCELCLAPFPSIIKLQNGNETMLLNFERPTTPYVMLEQCSQTQQKEAKTLHFILPEEGQRVHIGRGQQCQLNISDISVSRIHSIVTYSQNSFVIHDSNSKFGTLIEVKKQIEIKDPILLQHNGCSIEIEPKKVNERIYKSAKKNQKKKQ